MTRNSPSWLRDLVTTPVRHRRLIWSLVKRDFIGRYKGSFMGLVWSLLNPLLMLAIYTFVFSVVFKARWGTGGDDEISFGIFIFSGMIVHGLFSECLNRSANLIVSQPNFVKKVVFPLEILPWMALGSAALHFLVSFAVLLVFCLILGAPIQPGIVLIPLVLLPLTLVILGLSWLLASLGVYLRDLPQIIGMLMTVALFLAPIFYSIEVLPSVYQTIMLWNPITLPVIQLRDVMILGNPLDWGAWSKSLAVGVLVCYLGFVWFQKSKKGFADVV
jgi:lipopolysaccharide transport system permease protein